jgi:hypothetical protein
MGTYLQFPRVISADRASSCDPHGRGLDAQPWIQWPEVCTTPDPMAESMHNHGSQGRKFADVCKHSENVCKPSPAAAIPCGLFGIPSSDQRRPGQQYAQPWIPGPEVCTTPDPMAGSMKYADVCKHSENVCKQRPAVCKRLQTFGGRLQTKASSCDSLRAGWSSIE